MRLPPYSSYKPTGIDWLGDVPEHWGVGRVGALFRLKSGGTPSTEVADYWDGGIPWVSAKDMKSLRIVDTEDHITPRAVAESATSLVPAGSVLIVARSGILKHTLPVAVTEREVAINQDIKGCLPDPTRIDCYFFAYWVQGHQPSLLTLWRQQGATVESLDVEKVKTASLPVPPLPEQRAIADFLDRETAKIDMLVAKKRTLIERLKEKRTALISRTVTRGLPPDAARAAGLDSHPKLKPSGIDWLGDVPEHWDVSPIVRQASEIQTGPFGSQLHEADYVDGGIPLINPAHIVGGCLLPDDRSSVDEETAQRLSRHRLRTGDIIMARRGEIGRCALVTDAEAGWLCGTGALLLRLANSDPRYLVRVLSSSGFSKLLELRAVGTTMLNLNPAIVGRMLVPVPLEQEQSAIADFLDRQTSKIDNMVAKVENAIERLQEYRIALITAAVTGKIDVRREANGN